jgi:hypothetical protein
MAQIISYFPSPFLLFDRLLLPVRQIAAPSLFERGKAATALAIRFFSFFPRDVGDCGLTFGLMMGFERIHMPGIDHYRYACRYSLPNIALSA